MSHVATVELEVRDLDALAEAAKRCGLELVRDQKTYRWYGGQQNPCDHTIRIPDAREGKRLGAYEVGVIRRTDGRPGYVLEYDPWAGGKGLEELTGPKCGRLKQAYGVAVATQQARRQGFAVREQPLPNGSVKLLLSR